MLIAFDQILDPARVHVAVAVAFHRIAPAAGFDQNPELLT
jgi:hypothetical protein